MARRYCSKHILDPRRTKRLRAERTNSLNSAATSMDATLTIGYKPSVICEETNGRQAVPTGVMCSNGSLFGPLWLCARNLIEVKPLIDPVDIMQALARRRPVFHSEADFQHAFAWEIHRSAPECDIRLEVPVRATTGAIHLDLLARLTLGQMAIELKYKTRSLTAALNGEDFNLMSHAAQDLGRYDFFKDLNRIEAFALAG